MPEFLNPQQIVSRLDIKNGMNIADFGAGSGFFTSLFARLVGENGKVTALDVQKDVVELLKIKIKRENLLNVNVIWADVELPKGTKLPDGSQDVAFVSNILFQAEDKLAIIKEAMRILKPGGSLVVIEWDPEDPPPPGPPKNLRLPKQTLRDYCENIGFALFRELEAGLHHYGLWFRK